MATKAPPVVYIVDADAAAREAFTRLIRSAGLEARAHGSPEAFLEDVRDSPGACVLLDITPPHQASLRVLDRLGARGLWLPMITVSARDEPDTRRRARGLGARFFLRKPVDAQALLDAISWVTGRPPAR